MPRTKGELPSDLTPDELNEMIRNLAYERSCPYGVNPDLVELGEIPGYVYGENRGVMWDGKPWDGMTLYREGQKWRRKLIAELKRRPDWIAEWRAAKQLDERIEELCRRNGLHFKPWETPPWEADDGPSPWSPGTAGDISWKPAQRLRRQLIAELEAEDRKAAR